MAFNPNDLCTYDLFDQRDNEDRDVVILYKESETFLFSLYGKDGGLKSSEPVDQSVINRTIDVMPMRQNEMKD